MEDILKKLQSQGKSSVENIVQWLTDSGLVEKTAEGTQKAKALFEDVPDKANVNFENFRTALTNVAGENRKTFDEVSDLLAQKGELFLNAILAGVSAFNESMSSKKD